MQSMVTKLCEGAFVQMRKDLSENHMIFAQLRIGTIVFFFFFCTPLADLGSFQFRNWNWDTPRLGVITSGCIDSACIYFQSLDRVSVLTVGRSVMAQVEMRQEMSLAAASCEPTTHEHDMNSIWTGKGPFQAL